MPENLSTFLNSQPMFTGLVGATLVAGLMFLVRQAPRAIYNRLRDTFTTTLVIEQGEESFRFVTNWLAHHRASERARRLMMAEVYDYAQGRWRYKITLGRGWHVIRHKGAWILLHREITDGGDVAKLVGAPPMQRLWIMTIGRTQDAIRGLMEEARAAYFGDGLINIHVYTQGGWVCVDRRKPRPIETIFMPAAQKARVLDDVAAFLDAQHAYGVRGVPWRRGYLFKGPPGTGKTTLIFACAGQFGRPIYVLNLNNVRGDNDLIAAFNNTDHDGIIVIEDIDTFTVANDREAPVQLAPVLPSAAPQDRITLSGLLNAVDGLAAREGRLLFITSNHAEKIDAALLRPGRIDVVEQIEPLSYSDARRMVAAFGADPAVLEGVKLPVPAAELQGILLGTPEPLRPQEAA